ncbi:DUF5060 domain-containing protein [candidate division WOR-3 bacterium]|nr:DUF5060 domain-containing protein [candidate division WOR-3 bacterium]
MDKLKFCVLSGLMAILAISLVSCKREGPAGILVKPTLESMEKFETLFIYINLKAKFENPYDPEDIKVDAVIRPPDGDTIILPCFYENGVSGKSNWEARFTAMQAGTHSFHIRVIDKKSTSNSEEFYVSVKESGNDGFLRLNGKSFYSFVFDSGKRFRGVGLNIGWELQSDWKYTYEDYLDALRENNANFFRTWMCTWNLPLEWTRVVMSYKGTIVDEFENWDKVFLHSQGLKINLGKSQVNEDDTNRVAIESNSKETIIYNLKDIRRFKIKLYYHRNLSTDKIKCYSSPDNITYAPIDIEFSQVWNTAEDWYRMFVVYINELPEGTNYLRIEFLEDLEGSPELGSIQVECGEEKDVLDAPGLGRYYMKTAERLDEVFILAEERDIYIMLTLDYHGVFKSEVDVWASNAEWRTNPYNAKNGGPCEDPVDFFTNAEAKKIYKSKLRYMVARWGYSTNLACWELWNEIDNVMEWQKVPPAAIVSWHKEMANYLKRVDPYKHLVSTSISHREMPDLWEIENIDFSQHHLYGPDRNLQDIGNSVRKYIKEFEKPDVINEFAAGWKGPEKDYTALEYENEMHNGLWRGMFSPTPVLPLSWWWEWHYYKGHYSHLKSAADFVSMMLKNNEEILEEFSVASVDGDMEVMGLKSGDDIFLWLRNPNEEEKTDLVLNIQETDYLSYLMKYYDTWAGEFSVVKEIELLNGQLILQDIHLKSEKDMAVLIRPVE